MSPPKSDQPDMGENDKSPELQDEPQEGLVLISEENSPDAGRTDDTEPTPEERFIALCGALDRKLIDITLEKTRATEVVWPSIAFELNEQNIAGGEVMPASRGSRLRSAFSAVRSVAPDAVQCPAAQAGGESLKASEQYLKTSVNIGDTKLDRNVILDQATALGVLETFLVSQNDPVWQILNQIEERFGASLAKSDFNQLRTDLLLSAKQSVIGEIYRDYIAHYRSVVKYLDSVCETSDDT